MTRIVRAALAVVAVLALAACEPLNGSEPEPESTPTGFIADVPSNAFPLLPFDAGLGETTLQVEILYTDPSTGVIASIVEDEIQVTASGYIAGYGGFVPAIVEHTDENGNTTRTPAVNVTFISTPYSAISILDPGIAFATYVVSHNEINDGAALSCRITQNGTVLSQDLALPFPGLQTVQCTHLAATGPN